MSGDHVHCIFYQFDGEEFALRLKDYCAGRRYNVIFNMHKLRNDNSIAIPNSGVSILLITPAMCESIRSGKHPDLNVIFSNPDFSIAILFHVEKSKDEIASFLSSRIRNISRWTMLESRTDSSLSPTVIDIMDVVEKLEETCKSDPILQKFQVWAREGVKPHQQIIVIFQEPVDDDAQVKVIQDWNGVSTTAERLNPLTFSFHLGDAEPGDKKIEVFVNGTSYGIAVLHVMRLEPKMEQVFKFLNNVINPIELLCQCLHVVSNNRDNLDKKLVDLLSKSTNSVSNIFEEFDWEKYGDIKSNLALPTLLHFGAKYGFRQFCLELLKIPGGKQALKIENKDGLLPVQIAQKEGFEHLQLDLYRNAKANMYDMPSRTVGFKANGPTDVSKSKTLPARGQRTIPLSISMSEIRSPLIPKQTISTPSKTTVNRPRFYSDSPIQEESLSWLVDPEKLQEEQRLHRKMTKVTAARGEEDPQTRKRNNSMPELPGLGRLTRKEHPYEEDVQSLDRFALLCSPPKGCLLIFDAITPEMKQGQHRLYQKQGQHRLYQKQGHHRLYQKQGHHRLYQKQGQHRLYQKQGQHKLYQKQGQHRLYQKQGQHRLSETRTALDCIRNKDSTDCIRNKDSTDYIRNKDSTDCIRNKVETYKPRLKRLIYYKSK
ncbi:hypothetical protein ACJMK2_033324 [Sinanodonta woodiana]|uniref:DBB domain-containing protein n=1 Tax=Sinanodonta woodiana TaxID=1069815 RepID=A0ABD3WPH8_SINWO